ncbi:hypothetical protein EJ06DRAFT_526299 [Trichodelitschia bisporula]|uniref:Uncharacterized protein n=1 Tax=Trichodelitschia bisporula TaxID=703511 RepID=A0A6G1I846_9PEZI|nr:hypothetical protein EJ06DRAFT_526299 [Trichodelitschia bisporula]
MASHANSLPQREGPLIARVKGLLNATLRTICRQENLQVSGVKAQLQERIISHIRDIVDRGDAQSFESLVHLVDPQGTLPKPPIKTAPVHPAATPASIQAPSNYPSHIPYGMPGMPPGAPQSRYSTRLRFKPSPFFEVIEPLTNALELPVYSEHRNTLTLTLSLTPEHAQQLRSNSNMRIMLYCTADSHHQFAMSDVAFPAQLEVKVNGEEVRSNFKGIKNKPGSTRPADITAFVKQKQLNYKNSITVTYALTNKKYWMVPFLVKKQSVDELVAAITKRSVISKQRVLRDMQAKASDPDIEVGVSVLSLKDPVSYGRISTPCRANSCTHNQCFDAASFLQMQEQAPLWSCPICSKPVKYDDLAVDEYVKDILQSTPQSAESVQVQPNGEWTYGGNNSQGSKRNGVSQDAYDSDDDKCIEVTGLRTIVKGESGTPSMPPPLIPIRPFPNGNSTSSTNLSTPGPGQKRKSIVIDLTESDDEDARPAKRPALGTPVFTPTQNGFSLPRPPFAYRSASANSPGVQMRVPNSGLNSVSRARMVSSSSTHSTSSTNTPTPLPSLTATNLAMFDTTRRASGDNPGGGTPRNQYGPPNGW